MNEILTDTVDNGTIERVHIAPIGDFLGSDSKGNAIQEHITKESLEKLANALNSEAREVLFDIDHASAKPGIEKNTAAVGWFHKFVVDPIKGLFASLKLTKMGRDLIQNREYRYVSPTFRLATNGEPDYLHSIAATNLPAFAGHIAPILNSEATEISPNEKELIKMEMTKEELVSLIKDTVIALNTVPAEKKADEPQAEVVVANAEPEAKEEEKKEDAPKADEAPKAEDAPKGEAPKEEAPKADAPKEEKPVAEKAEGEKKAEEKKAEVIKIEALNSEPTVTLNAEPEWKSLTGKAFRDWCDAGKWR